MLTDQIYAAVTESGVLAKKLTKVQCMGLIENIEKLFGMNLMLSEAAWSDEDAALGKFDPNGYRAIAEYVGQRRCILIVRNAESAWAVYSGSDLLKIISGSVGFEFYVCDEEVKYLICYNDHDYIIAWGYAREWVRQLV
jgi:hypothetical protein